MNSQYGAYVGRVYVRPIGRGICLIDRQDDLQLEDLLGEGYWEVTFTARRLDPDGAKQAEKEWDEKMRSR